jgi:hypothetical protein
LSRKRHEYLALFLFMAVISSVAHAERGDNTAPSSNGQKPAVLTTTSYFEGTWVGNWLSESRDGTGRDVTITVGPKNPDGTFDMEYSWGSGKDIQRNYIMPGTVKGKGREDGEKLVFEFNDPLSLRINSLVMTKYENVKAMAQTSYEARKLKAVLTRK